MSLDTFEQSLLTELRQHVLVQSEIRPVPGRRWVPRLAIGGLATASAAVIATLAMGSTLVSPSAAYAVESQPNGDVVVTVDNLANASGLEHALAANGVHAAVTYAPGFSQSAGRTPTSSSVDRAACYIALSKVGGGLRFTLGAAQIANGSQLDIVTSGSSPTDVGSPVEVIWSGGGC